MIALMSGERVNTVTAVEKREKAKVAIVGLIDSVPSILVLTRSGTMDVRPGGGDWAGGELKPGETPRRAMKREGGEELPGIILKDITKLTAEPISKTRDGVLVVSHLFAATAQLPPGGITLSDEHSGYDWVPFDEFPSVDIPNKYKKAATSEPGRLILDRLALSLQDEPALT